MFAATGCADAAGVKSIAITNAVSNVVLSLSKTNSSFPWEHGWISAARPITEAQCRIRRQHGAVLLEDERRAEGHKLVPDVGYLCPGLDGPHLRNVGAGIGMLMIPCAPHLFFWISRFEHKTSAPA